MPVTPVELEDGGLFSGFTSWYKAIDGVFADSDFSTGVQAMLDGTLVGVSDPVHPVIRRHVLVPQLRTEIIVSPTTHERTYGHGLSYGLEVEGVGIEPENGLARLLAPNLGFSAAMMPGKDNTRATHDVPLDRLVQIFIIFVKQGEIGSGVPGCLEEKLTRDAGHGDGRFEHINAFVEVELLEQFDSEDERLDVQIIVPD